MRGLRRAVGALAVLQLASLRPTATAGLPVTPLHPVQPYNRTEHMRYQRFLFRALRSTWKKECSLQLTDIALYRKWEADGVLVRGWVLLPVSWRCIIEIYPRARKGQLVTNHRRLADVLDILLRRNRAYRHATLMMQSNPTQLMNAMLSRTSPWFRDSGWSGDLNSVFGADVTIFDTRLMRLFWAATSLRRPPFAAEMVPVPLHRKHRKRGRDGVRAELAKVAPPAAGAFWAGSCHGTRLRQRLRRVLRAGDPGLFDGVRGCSGGRGGGPKIKSERDFVAGIRQHTWALAPRGTFPAAFSMYEALTLERLPVYIADFASGASKDNSPRPSNATRALWKLPPPEALLASPALPQAEMLKHFAYADEIDWGRLAVAIDASELGELATILRSKAAQVPQMLAYAREVAPRFAPSYLPGYMRRWMERHPPAAGAVAAEPGRPGPALGFST